MAALLALAGGAQMSGGNGDGEFDFEQLLDTLAADDGERAALLRTFYLHMVDVVRHAEDEQEARDYAILAMCVQGSLVTEDGVRRVLKMVDELTEGVSGQVAALAVVLEAHRKWSDEISERLLERIANLGERIDQIEHVCPGIPKDEEEQ